MAAASQSSSSSPSRMTRTATAVSLILALILIIIFAAWFTQRMRPSTAPVVYRSRVQRREIQDIERKGIDSLVLETIPIVKYSMGIQSMDQRRASRNGGSYLLPLSSPPSTRKKVLEKTGLATVKEDTTSKNLELSDSCHKSPPETHIPSNRSQISPHDEASECPICTEEFRERENVRVLPCTHIYHRRCIDPWLLQFAGTCPLW